MRSKWAKPSPLGAAHKPRKSACTPDPSVRAPLQVFEKAEDILVKEQHFEQAIIQKVSCKDVTRGTYIEPECSTDLAVANSYTHDAICPVTVPSKKQLKTTKTKFF